MPVESRRQMQPSGADHRHAAAVAALSYTGAAGRPVVAVFHAPAVLRHAKSADGSSLVEGKKLTGFSNSEKRAAGLTDVVPFLVQDMLVELGSRYSCVPDWQPHALTDGQLITDQNAASSAPAARALLARIQSR